MKATHEITEPQIAYTHCQKDTLTGCTRTQVFVCTPGSTSISEKNILNHSTSFDMHSTGFNLITQSNKVICLLSATVLISETIGLNMDYSKLCFQGAACFFCFFLGHSLSAAFRDH